MHRSQNKRLKQFVELFFSKLYVIIISSIVIICIILPKRIQYACKNEYCISNYFSLMIGIVLFIFFYYVTNLFKDKKKDSKMIVMTIILIPILFFLSRNYSFKTGWDPNKIINASQLIAQNEYKALEKTYFSMYPNNILITKVFSLAFKLAEFTKISNGYNYILLLNCFIYAWTGFFIYKIVNYLIDNSNISIMAWIIYVLLVGFSPWIIIPYSDSLALGIVTLEAFLFFCATKWKDKKRIVFVVLLLITSVFGYYIKPQCIIIIISIFIISILYFLERKLYCKKEIKQYMLYIIVISITIIFSIFMVKSIINKGSYEINKEKKFGINHFLMMGWNEEGGGIWYLDDLLFSKSFNSYDERNKANIQEFKSRIKNMKFKGIIKHVIRKTLTNYNDGTFAYGKEGNFYLEDYNTGNIQLRKILSNIYKENGKQYWIFKQIMQILWITVLFFNIFSFSKNKKIQVLQLSILGLTLFELLFEARARYLLAYAPIYIIIACVGFDNIIKLLKKTKFYLRYIDKNENTKLLKN